MCSVLHSEYMEKLGFGPMLFLLKHFQKENKLSAWNFSLLITAEYDACFYYHLITSLAVVFTMKNLAMDTYTQIGNQQRKEGKSKI